MKNVKNLFLSILILAYIHVNGQCERGIRTNPNDPFNEEFEQSFPNLNNPFTNHFNWAEYSILTLKDIELNPNAGWSISTHSMFSPYSLNMPPEYNYLYTIDNKVVPIDQLDWHWEDGWELMYLNTGYYPDGTEINNPDPNSIINTSSTVANSNVPYFVLYNRYTAKFRVFSGLYAPFGEAQDIYMKLGYNLNGSKINPVSAIFRSLGNYDRPMDVKTKYDGVTTFNKNANNDHTWFSSDIQLSYDPCVCQFNTNFTFAFDVVQKLSVNLYGREISLLENLDVAQKDFLNQSAVEQGGTDGNNLLYKRLDKMYADYQTQLVDYNTKRKDYNSIQNVVKRKVIGIARDAFVSGIAGAIPTNDVKKFLLKSNFKLLGKEFPDTNTAEGWAKLAKEGAKGLAGEGFDYLSQTLFGKDNAPVAPTMPSATFSEMRISGTIGKKDPVFVSNLYTPGSYSPNGGTPLTAFNYPIYNEAVGLFALLEKPSVDLYSSLNFEDVRTRDTTYLKVKVNADFPYPISYDTLQVPGIRNFIAHSAAYIKLNQPLKYRFNHAVDFNLNKTGVFVSFEVEYYTDYQWIKNGPFIDSFDSLNYFYNRGNMDLLHMYDDISVHHRSFNTKWVPVEDAGQQVFGVEFTDSLTQRRDFKLPNFIYSEYLVESLWPPRIRRIKMKLMSDMYFNQQSYSGAEINTTQVFTYLIYDDSNPQEVTSNVNLATNINDISKYKLGELVLDGQFIHPYSELVTDVQGTELFVDAESVKVAGNLLVLPGYNLHVRSLNDIEILGETDFSPEVTFENKRDFFSVGKASEVSDTELLDFCGGDHKKYAAGVVLTKKGENVIQTADADNKQEELSSLKIYPNPVTDILNIDIENGVEGMYDLVMIDLLGKIVFESSEYLKSNVHTYFSTSEYSNGVYFVKISNNETSVCKRIVINH
jgi:hypothetical protein